jgi:cell wall-associated protease
VLEQPAVPLTGVALAVDQASPQPVGTAVTFTANPTGGSNAQYQFRLRNLNGTWTDVQNYSTDATWEWNTSGVTPGTYRIVVWAKEATSVATYDKYSYVDYTVTQPVVPLTAVNLSPSATSPQLAGTAVTFTATPTGGNNVLYQFRLRNLNGTWSDVQAYSTDATWEWNTNGVPPGTYRIVVWAKESISTELYDRYAYKDFVITP